jgi:hypothetical protein
MDEFEAAVPASTVPRSSLRNVLSDGANQYAINRRFRITCPMISAIPLNTATVVHDTHASFQT